MVRRALPRILFDFRLWLGGLLFAGAGTAFADCQYVSQGLREKIQSYTTFRSINQATLDKLLATETNCQRQGATISSKLASLAAAKSCEAELDASGIDKKMSEIGAQCTTRFSEINALQGVLRAQFHHVRADLELGTKMLTKSRILNANCGAEVRAAVSMVQKFLALDSKVVATQSRSLDGKVNYGKFTQTAKTLQAATHAKGESCRQLATSLTRVLGGVGTSAPKSGRKPARSSSDVTGIDQDKAKAKAGASKRGNP